jgi:hypothetical protein
MVKHAEDKLSTGVKVISGIVIVVLVGLGATMVRMVLTEDKVRHKAVHTVTLLKPPPPTKVEKPPEQEVKQEKPQESQVIQQDVPDSKSDKDEPPPGDQLGLDAEGGAGGDAFGLVGRKGGRALVGSDPNGGPQSLMQKYGWYVRIIEDQISKELVRKAKLPQGGLQTYVIISLDEKGNIVKYRIYNSSGSGQMDNAVYSALGLIKRISEPPPEGMPRVLKIRISSSA